MTKKIKCALIGPGNIGTDLLAKLQRSPVLEPVWMVGIDPNSDGLKRAKEMGIKTTAEKRNWPRAGRPTRSRGYGTASCWRAPTASWAPAKGRRSRPPAAAAGRSPARYTPELCREGGNRVMVVLFYRTEGDMRTFLRCHHALMGSDGSAIARGRAFAAAGRGVSLAGACYEHPSWRPLPLAECQAVVDRAQEALYVSRAVVDHDLARRLAATPPGPP